MSHAAILLTVVNTKYWTEMIPIINEIDAQFPCSSEIYKLIMLMYPKGKSTN
jgi:hypothetical protein